MIDLEKLNSISTTDTTWIKSGTFREQNRDWLLISAKVALIVLRVLKDKAMNQKDLAGLLDVTPQRVSKIVKGKENLTVETICNVEKALSAKIFDISLIQ